MRLSAKLVCIFLGFRRPKPELEADADAVLAWWRARRGTAAFAYGAFCSLVVVPPLVLVHDTGSGSAATYAVGILVPHLVLWLLLAIGTSPFIGKVVVGSDRVDDLKAFSLRTLAIQWATAIGGLLVVSVLMFSPLGRGGVLHDAGEEWIQSLGQWWALTNQRGYVSLSLGWLAGFAVARFIVQPIRSLRQKAEEQSRRLLVAEAHAQALARSRAEAELRLLQGQIEPHFLYNTLANLRYLIQTQSPDALRMVDALIEYLQSSLPAMRAGEVPLARELRHVEHYLQLMQIRMPERLRYRIDVPSHLLGVPVPPLSVLTLVENAIKHGIAPRVEGGTVAVAARELPQGLLRLEVADDGGGVAAAAATDSGGTGLANLRERIKLAYGERASLVLADRLPHGTRAILTLPFGRSADAPPKPAAADEIAHG